MKRLLLSGFEPFAGYAENPSALLAESLASAGIEGCETKAVVLPVSFARAFLPLELVIADFRPDFVVSFGLGIGRAHLGVERIAINRIEARIPDNDGAEPKEMAIRRGGRDGIFSPFPLAAMVASAKAAGAPAEISNSAGTYVCNYVMYRALEMSKKTGFRAGFIHVPLLPEQAKSGEVSLPFARAEAGLRAMLETLVLTRDLPSVESFDDN